METSRVKAEMIDDITLAEWLEGALCSCGDAPFPGHSILCNRYRFKALVDEIRRLREEPNIWIDVLKADLAAHQAVVRDMHICFEVLKDLWHKTNRTMADLEAGQRTIERGLALAVWGNEI